MADDKSWDLGDGFRLVAVTAEELDFHYQKHKQAIFGERLFSPRELVQQDDLLRMDVLKKQFEAAYHLRLLLKHEDELAGWHCGYQQRTDTFYMQNSAILPPYRRQGLYTKIVKTVVDEVRALGFQVICSRHLATNNPVIIAKLKLGFQVYNVELSEMYGFLVGLHYLPSDKRRSQFEASVEPLLPA